MNSQLAQNARRLLASARSFSVRPHQEYFQSSSQPTYMKKKDFGFLDLMFLNLFVIGPSLYLSGAANIRGKTNKKD